MRRIWLVAALVGLAVLAGLAACSDDEPEGPFEVGTRTVTYVDESRTTPPTGELPERSSRTLVTHLWYPEGDGRFPLVVFSHGQSGAPEDYAPVFERWARAGYVVAAPRHPVTVRGTPGGPVTGDFLNQPGDLSFVISRLAAEEKDLVDVDHVAAAGHSSGAIVALGTGANTCCRDDRIDAIVIMSVRPVPFDGEYFAPGLPDTPTLFFHGTRDQYFLFSDGRKVFDEAPPPKFFVTITDGSHSEPYRRGPPDPRLVADASIAFFDRYLDERDDALEDLDRTVAKYDFAKLDAVPE